MEMDLFHLTLDIKFCRISYHDKEWVEKKTKCDYTIWNIISGSLALEINGKTIKAAQGDVLLFHPGDTYKAWCFGDDHCYFLVTFFSLYASFLTFFSGLSSQFGLQTPFHGEQKSTPSVKLHSLLDYIEQNIGNNLSVRDLSEYMNMSEKYFSSFFHLNIGMTPKQYLTKCRMTHALTFLANPDYSLQDVSNLLCYADQYSFAKAFKNYYGEAPGLFRRQYLLNQ